MGLIRVAFACWNKPQVLWAIFRVLAWPPSRIRYDRARQDAATKGKKLPQHVKKQK